MTMSEGWLRIALALGLVAPLARPQVGPLLQGPGRTPPELPSFEPEKHTPGNILPPIALPPQPGLDSLFTGVRVFIRDVRITGNTVIARDELDRIAAPYKGRQLSFADLERLRDQLTVAYIQRGYVSSGAVIPDQDIRDGVVEIRIVEGTLGAIEAKTEGRLRKGYVPSRLRLGTSQVVNIGEIEEALQMLRQNSRIRSIDAELVPSDVRGKSLLRVHAAEAAAPHVTLRCDNQQAVAVGSARGLVDFSDQNLTGLGDTFSATFRGTHGLRAVDAAYTLPLGPRDTTLTVSFDRAQSSVVEQPFASLDINSRMETYGLTLQQPVFRTLRSELDLFVTGELRRSQSFLLGSGFQFSEDMTEDGVSRISVLRIGQSWTRRGIGQALALRNSLSIGLNIFGATFREGPVADGRFLSWLGQFQWAHRLRALGAGGQLIVRADAQLSNSPLLGLEKFVLGGHDTVRGYRENALVRDNGLVGSIETRIPILTRGDAATVLELAPFTDLGRGWNRARASRHAQTLPSAGVGLRWRMRTRIQAELYWGHAFRDLQQGGKWSLQDSGIEAGFSWSLP
jgi:hemolysin activation/secretion protein